MIRMICVKRARSLAHAHTLTHAFNPNADCRTFVCIQANKTSSSPGSYRVNRMWPSAAAAAAARRLTIKQNNNKKHMHKTKEHFSSLFSFVIYYLRWNKIIMHDIRLNRKLTACNFSRNALAIGTRQTNAMLSTFVIRLL